MKEHSPPPWYVHGKGFRRDMKNGGEFVPVYANSAGWIADVRESMANARLIAAAPDLLAALEGLLEIHQKAIAFTCHSSKAIAAANEATAAIAKARMK